MTPIRTALVGYGFAARTFHKPFLDALPEFQLCAVSSRQRDRVMAECNGARIYADAAQMIAESDVELVIITAPNDAHFTLARHALNQGRHVVVDKPFACSSSEGERLIELAHRQSRLLSVYHNRRWDGDFLTVRQLLTDKRVGRVRLLESHIDRFRPHVRQRWREQPGSGTGIWFDLGPHLVDQALQLFGPPEAITGRCRALRDGSTVTDYFQVQLHYPALEVVLSSSPYCAAPSLRFQLQGDEGCYRKYDLDPQEERLIGGTNPISHDWAQESPNAFGTLYQAEGSETIPTRCGGYQHYYRALAASLRKGTPNPVPASEALLGLRVIECALASSQAQHTLTFSA